MFPRKRIDPSETHSHSSYLQRENNVTWPTNLLSFILMVITPDTDDNTTVAFGASIGPTVIGAVIVVTYITINTIIQRLRTNLNMIQIHSSKG